MELLLLLIPIGLATANHLRVRTNIRKTEAELKAKGLKPVYVGGGMLRAYYVVPESTDQITK